MFKLFKKKSNTLDLTKLSPEQLKALAEGGAFKVDEPVGDGKAEFLDEGYVEEAKDLKREEDGTKPWYDRLKKLI